MSFLCEPVEDLHKNTHYAKHFWNQNTCSCGRTTLLWCFSLRKADPDHVGPDPELLSAVQKAAMNSVFSSERMCGSCRGH